MENTNYFGVNAISYSMLRALSIGPAYYKFTKEQESEEKEHFVIGTAVDCMLTEPDNFWDTHYLDYSFNESLNVPTGQMLKFIDFLVNNENCGELYENCYNEAYEYAGFKQKKVDTVIDDFKNNYKDYYDALLSKKSTTESNKNKQRLTTDQLKLINNICDSLKNNQFTAKYFNNTNDSVKVFNQLEIYWKFKGLDCKSKLDKVLIDNENKLITIVDLKTTGNSTFSFSSSALKWRYDLQSCFYSTALYWLIHESDDVYWHHYKDYKFNGFKFVVESTKSQGFPLIYSCSDKFLDMGLKGFWNNGKKYKGVLELVDDYKWYLEKDSWSYNREIIENNGEIELRYD